MRHRSDDRGPLSRVARTALVGTLILALIGFLVLPTLLAHHQGMPAPITAPSSGAPTSTAPSASASASPSVSASETPTEAGSASPTDEAQSGSAQALPGGATAGPGGPSAPDAPPGPVVVGGWPSAASTGVPDGIALRPYAGPCLITDPMTLDGVDATGCGALSITASSVTIQNSVLPRVTTMPGGGVGAVTITDSEVRAGGFTDGAVAGRNLSLTRVEVTGGATSVNCAGNCTVIDSYLHGQSLLAGQTQHEEAFLSNGGTGMTVRGNRMACTTQPNGSGGGCTSVLSLFGDFGPIADVVIDGNYFTANSTGQSYCLYGGYNPDKPYGTQTRNVRITNNVFESGPNGKCGIYGPVAAFLTGNGNTWSGNTWWDAARQAPGAALSASSGI